MSFPQHELANRIQESFRDFDNHEGMFFQVSKPHSILQGVFVHKTYRGQAAGGVRFWKYETVEDYLRDGLRLARAMTQKNALAGLWWGGGKGVMARNPAESNEDPILRKAVYEDFGKLCSKLKGCYVAAEDVGTTVEDMNHIFSRTRFATCIPQSLGGSGNPSILTARGVLCGMEAALDATGSGPLGEVTVAIQGLGNVGSSLFQFLIERGVKKIIACDIEPRRVEKVKEDFPSVDFELWAAAPKDSRILESQCDILSPNATGGVLNPTTIPKIKAKIICGGANNQLEDLERDDSSIHKRGIYYVPDFLVNRMGIVNCANEQYGCVTNDEFIERHLAREWENSIYNSVLNVLESSQASGETPGKIATQIADRLALKEHPIFGRRGKKIIDSLVTSAGLKDN